MSHTTPSSRPGALPDVSAGHWTLDPAGTTVGFQHRTFWGLLNVKGVFAEVGGDGEVLAGGGAHGSVTIGAASLDTRNAKRDEHLRSADFFDVETHPSLVFTATEVTPSGDATVHVTGDLTVLGVTRALSFTAKASEISADAVTLTAELPVERGDFGMSWNQAGMLKPLTRVTIAARFTRRAD
ncbi:hypothetical protein BKI49_32095 [Streptomyces sp. Tue6028]|uniref:YceI family protein n=1 Tax=Streptomyces sp. Tue6028 TaxID=2036037 RepID=UPI000BB349ED|nr:YceI family protein [Streptomyces sp. Tue6028]PBC60041.1 hypothetical protein BKI49_32095 [Streptomyces sp. Tue6028]